MQDLGVEQFSNEDVVKEDWLSKPVFKSGFTFKGPMFREFGAAVFHRNSMWYCGCVSKMHLDTFVALVKPFASEEEAKSHCDGIANSIVRSLFGENAEADADLQGL